MKETRHFTLKDSDHFFLEDEPANNNFENFLCSWLIKTFKWEEVPGKTEIDIVKSQLDVEDLDAVAKRVVPFFEEKITHYISKIHLGASESWHQHEDVREKAVGVGASAEQGASIEGNFGYSSGNSSASISGEARGYINEVEEGKGEAVINQAARPLYHLLGPDQQKLKYVLEKAIELYCIRKRK